MRHKSRGRDGLVWSGTGRDGPTGRRIFYSPAFWWSVDAELAAPDTAELARFLAAAHLPLQPREGFEAELRDRLAPELAELRLRAVPEGPETPKA
jgi:hypothetical protein